MCGIVAFWSAGQASLIDAVFRRSKLFRDKWDEAHSADNSTYGETTIRAALEADSGFYDWKSAAPTAEIVGGLRLVVKSVRRTNTKIIANVELQRDSKPIDLVKLSDAPASRKDARKIIVAHAGESFAKEIDEALGKLLVRAAEQKAASQSAGQTIHDILVERIPGEIDLRFCADGGKAYSEALGQTIGRTQFVERFTNQLILQLAATAADCPHDPNGNVQRQQLISVVERELKILWGELICGLKPIDEVEQLKATQAAEAFHQSLLTLWTKPTNMAIVRHRVGERDGRNQDSVQLACRTSLGSRVQTETFTAGGRSDRWVPVQAGYAAFYRIVPSDQRIIRLAMRFELAQQIGVALPHCRDHRSFCRIGRQFGALLEEGAEKDRMTGGNRLGVLSPGLCDLILAQPLEDSESSDGERIDAASLNDGVTQEVPSLAEIIDGKDG